MRPVCECEIARQLLDDFARVTLASGFDSYIDRFHERSNGLPFEYVVPPETAKSRGFSTFDRAQRLCYTLAVSSPLGPK
jgi:hypothetical protein